MVEVTDIIPTICDQLDRRHYRLACLMDCGLSLLYPHMNICSMVMVGIMAIIPTIRPLRPQVA